jgi:hypothetical protein
MNKIYHKVVDWAIQGLVCVQKVQLLSLAWLTGSIHHFSECKNIQFNAW